LTLSAHLGPLNPAGQRQRISPFDWWHVPPLRHGDGSTHLIMESTAFSHKDPEKLDGQMQDVPLPVGCSWHDPPLRQENSGRWQSDPRSCWHRSPMYRNEQRHSNPSSLMDDGEHLPKLRQGRVQQGSVVALWLQTE
jgi:hypothetical protein